MEDNRKLILVLEDDFGLNELINERIENDRYKAVSFYEASSAISWLKDNSPLLIVLDYGLPDMTGKEFLSELKKNIVEIPPFIISTGQGDERIAVEMMKLGARDYIVKDTNFLEMLPMIVHRVSSEIENELKLNDIELAYTELNKFNKQIIDNAQEGIIVFDSKLNCKLWNPFMENITGSSQSEVIGMHVSKVVPIDDCSLLSCHIESVLNGKIVPESDYSFNAKDGAEKGWLSISLSPLSSSKGEITSAICIVHDISERKINERALAKKVDQLQHMNGFMVDREIRMVAIKKEVNELLLRLGEEKRYK